jgi:hypothetical protein
MVERYVLIDQVVHPAAPEDYDAFWQAEDPGRIGLDVINDIEVSTVFLARPAGHDPSGAPLLFETALFGAGGHIGVLRRYAHWQEASLGHRAVVDELRRAKAN